MDFKTYWQGLKVPERDALAQNIGTSIGYCHQIAYGGKRVELGLADAIVMHTDGIVTLDDLPLTGRAVFQRAARGGAKVKVAPPAQAEPNGA
jgi:hypothetical protein